VTCIVEAGDARQGHFDGKAIHSLTDGPQLSFGYKISKIKNYIKNTEIQKQMNLINSPYSPIS
jgi:hypothetical protein